MPRRRVSKRNHAQWVKTHRANKKGMKVIAKRIETNESLPGRTSNFEVIRGNGTLIELLSVVPPYEKLMSGSPDLKGVLSNLSVQKDISSLDSVLIEKIISGFTKVLQEEYPEKLARLGFKVDDIFHMKRRFSAAALLVQSGCRITWDQAVHMDTLGLTLIFAWYLTVSNKGNGKHLNLKMTFC